MITSKLSRSVPCCVRLSGFTGKLTVVTALTAMALGGCASTGESSLASLKTPTSAKPFVPLQKNAAPIDRAVQYWAQAFAQNPGDEKAAVAYARNLRAKGQKKKALQVLQRASISNSSSRAIASEYARVAIDLGQIKFAQKLIQRATDPRRPDWRLISAQGAGLAKQGKHKEAQGYFLKALQLKPSHPPLLNNLALAYALNGDIDDAEQLLRKAAARGQKLGKIRQNLALVLGVQGKFNESQTVAQSVYRDDGKAKTNTEFLKRWVKASPQTAPQVFADTGATTASGAGGSWATTASTSTLRGPAQPERITPWATETQTADASWQTEVGAGH